MINMRVGLLALLISAWLFQIVRFSSGLNLLNLALALWFGFISLKMIMGWSSRCW